MATLNNEDYKKSELILYIWVEKRKKEKNDHFRSYIPNLYNLSSEQKGSQPHCNELT